MTGHEISQKRNQVDKKFFDQSTSLSMMGLVTMAWKIELFQEMILNFAFLEV